MQEKRSPPIGAPTIQNRIEHTQQRKQRRLFRTSKLSEHNAASCLVVLTTLLKPTRVCAKSSNTSTALTTPRQTIPSIGTQIPGSFQAWTVTPCTKHIGNQRAAQRIVKGCLGRLRSCDQGHAVRQDGSEEPRTHLRKVTIPETLPWLLS